ncbi:hypothetical protein ACJIZ3_010273 [Penstemon smallii]|uniref:Uncharacterized protein n=1 Tax=Penstemon smallii TaxID=265156 RepID=A0ABD3TGT9_9LAMI
MGNCQAVDSAALVIQHPSGKLEMVYWPLKASEVMKMNPGHYVSLLIPLPDNSGDKTVRFTKVKLLRPSDTLVLGRAYRLVTTQEVMKVIRAKKHAKMKKSQSESGENFEMNREKRSTTSATEPRKFIQEEKDQDIKPERHQQRSGSTNSTAVLRPKSWRPSLQSISESGS